MFLKLGYDINYSPCRGSSKKVRHHNLAKFQRIWKEVSLEKKSGILRQGSFMTERSRHSFKYSVLRDTF